MEFKLIKPYEGIEEQYISYIQEWESSEEKIVPYASRRHHNEFIKLLDRWQEAETDKVREMGLVPASIFFMVDNKEKIYGAVDIRHDLNEYLLQVGGHIGYGIRPSERRKGYATKMLSLALIKAKEIGIEKALVTCNNDNYGSAGTIKNNGGILENEFHEDNGNIVERYWINLL